MPGILKQCINEASIPDNTRNKSYEFDIDENDNIVWITWITQEPFTSSEADKLAKEIVRAIRYNLKENNFDEKVNVQIEITARDGKEYGSYLNDFNIEA